MATSMKYLVATAKANDRRADRTRMSYGLLRRMVRAAIRADRQANAAADRELHEYGTTGFPIYGGWGGTHAAYITAVRAGCGHITARRWAYRISNRYVSMPTTLPGGQWHCH